jgi:hypothetical protein
MLRQLAFSDDFRTTSGSITRYPVREAAKAAMEEKQPKASRDCRVKWKASLTERIQRMDNRDSAQIAGVTQLVECDLAKVDVAGSNPVSRSKKKMSGPDT